MKRYFPWRGLFEAFILLVLAAGSIAAAWLSKEPQENVSDPVQNSVSSAGTESTVNTDTNLTEISLSTEVTDPEYTDVTPSETQSETGTDTETDVTDTKTDVTDTKAETDVTDPKTETDTEEPVSTSTIPLSEILGHITPPPDGSPKKIAFTFDDGPYTPVTRGLVDEFAKYGGHCTFFVVGNRIHGTQKEAMKYAFDQGNEIAIHAYTHTAYYNTCSNSVYQFELQKTAEEILNTTGKLPTLMRPVGGSISNERVANCPYSVILWNVDTKDWKYRNADTVARNILNAVTAGDIILLHDLYPTSLEAIKIVLPLLQEHGYEFVTVSELLGDEIQTGKKYTNAY